MFWSEGGERMPVPVRYMLFLCAPARGAKDAGVRRRARDLRYTVRHSQSSALVPAWRHKSRSYTCIFRDEFSTFAFAQKVVICELRIFRTMFIFAQQARNYDF